jgi:hypothetical protein
MTDLLLTSFLPNDGQARAAELTAAQSALKQMVLDSVTSPHTRRNYAKALDNLFLFSAGRPLIRPLLQEWTANMDGLVPSTPNVRRSAVRRLVGEARKHGLIGAEVWMDKSLWIFPFIAKFAFEDIFRVRNRAFQPCNLSALILDHYRRPFQAPQSLHQNPKTDLSCARVIRHLEAGSGMTALDISAALQSMLRFLRVSFLWFPAAGKQS